MALPKLTVCDEAMELLRAIVRPTRVPTLCWLFADYFNCTDFQGRCIIQDMESRGLVTVDSGGWIKVKQ